MNSTGNRVPCPVHRLCGDRRGLPPHLLLLLLHLHGPPLGDWREERLALGGEASHVAAQRAKFSPKRQFDYSLPPMHESRLRRVTRTCLKSTSRGPTIFSFFPSPHCLFVVSSEFGDSILGLSFFFGLHRNRRLRRLLRSQLHNIVVMDSSICIAHWFTMRKMQFT